MICSHVLLTIASDRIAYACLFYLFIILPEKVVKIDDNGQREENYDDDQLDGKHNLLL